MPEDVGAKVSLKQIAEGLGPENGKKMIPGYDGGEIGKYVLLDPLEENTCSHELIVDYNAVNFVVFATDTGMVGKFLKTAGSVIDIVTGAPFSPKTVINVGSTVVSDISAALDQEKADSQQKFHFPVHLCCHVKHQPFIVTLRVRGRILITDKGDADDSVQLEIWLDAHGETDYVKLFRDGQKLATGQPKSFIAELQVGFSADTDFQVSIQLDENCKADFMASWEPAISLIRIDDIKVIIQTAEECKEGATIPPKDIPDITKQFKVPVETSEPAEPSKKKAAQK